MSRAPDPSRRRFLLGGIFKPAAEIVANVFERKIDSVTKAAGNALTRQESEPSPETGRPIPTFRPPHAAPESQFDDLCTKCEDCINACPHDAIVHAPIQLRGVARSPIIDPSDKACQMCHDFPCVQACDTGALDMQYPVKIGTAMLSNHDCLAVNRLGCSVCSERCPEEGAIVREKGSPRFNPAKCTGCGICHELCPAPRNAVIMLPRPAK